MSTKAKIIPVFIAVSMLICNAQVIDTLYSVPQMDGYLLVYYSDSTYRMDNITTSFGAGDGLSATNGKPYFVRSFLSFDLDKITKDTSIYKLSQAILQMYQLRSGGNGVLGQYPMFGPNDEQLPCILDHINYDSTIDISDLDAGDVGNPKTFHTNIGFISNNADTGTKELNITQYVLNDFIMEREYSQYRMRFEVSYDDDLKLDEILFRSGNSTLGGQPKLIIYWDTTVTSVQDFDVLSKKAIELRSFPNPFNNETFIEFPNQTNNNFSIKIFNVLGRVVDELYPAVRNNRVTWRPKDLSSGVYYAVVYQKNIFVGTTKLVLMR